MYYSEKSWLKNINTSYVSKIEKSVYAEDLVMDLMIIRLQNVKLKIY